MRGMRKWKRWAVFLLLVVVLAVGGSRTAQRVVVMHKGNVLMDGTPREIFTQVDKLRAASLTVPQTIEVLYDLDQQDGEKLPIDALSIEECADILEQEYLN